MIFVIGTLITVTGLFFKNPAVVVFGLFIMTAWVIHNYVEEK